MSGGFSGSGDRLEASISFGTTATVMFWYRSTTTKAWTYSTVLDLLNLGYNTACLYDCANAGVGTVLTWYNGNTETTGSTLTTDQWYHIALVRNGTAITVYLDGVADITATAGSLGNFSRVRFGENIVWGEANGGMRITAVKAWTAALTSTEIAAEIDNADATKTANLVGQWWIKNGGSQTDDTSGANNDFTESGTVTDEADPSTSVLTYGGSAGINGAVSKTLGALTSNAAGALTLTGQTSATLASVTSSAAGQLLIVGTLAKTLDAATVTAAGALVSGLSAELARTLADVTISATGQLPIAGTTGATLDAVTVSASGTLPIAGATGATLEGATSSAAGTLAITGQASVTLDAATVSATGAGVVGLSGALAQTLANATTSATGALAISGQTGATLADATSEASGQLAIAGTAGATLASVTSNAAGQLLIGGAASVTLGGVTVNAIGKTVLAVGVIVSVFAARKAAGTFSAATTGATATGQAVGSNVNSKTTAGTATATRPNVETGA